MLTVALLLVPARWLLLPLARILRIALLGLLLPSTTLLALLLPCARPRGVALPFPATAIAALLAAAHGDTVGLDDRCLSLRSGLRPSHPRLLGPILLLRTSLPLRTRLLFDTTPFLSALRPLRFNALLLLLLFHVRLAHFLRLLLARFTARRFTALFALLLALGAASSPTILVLRHCRCRYRHQHRGQNHLTHLSRSQLSLPLDRLLGVRG